MGYKWYFPSFFTDKTTEISEGLDLASVDVVFEGEEDWFVFGFDVASIETGMLHYCYRVL